MRIRAIAASKKMIKPEPQVYNALAQAIYLTASAIEDTHTELPFGEVFDKIFIKILQEP